MWLHDAGRVVMRAAEVRVYSVSSAGFSKLFSASSCTMLVDLHGKKIIL